MKDYLAEFLHQYHWDPAKALLRAHEARVLEHCEFEGPVLDLGCGDGTFVNVLMRESHVVGLDFRFKNSMAALKKEAYSAALVSDARCLSFKDGVFNTIIVNSFFEHIAVEDLESILLEVHRILKGGGHAILTLNSEWFGCADPLKVVLERAGLHHLGRAWQRYRDRRLGLFSLKGKGYWQDLFGRADLRIMEEREYLPPDAERSFFFWTEVQYIGISRLNIGSIARVISKVLTRFGSDVHRRAIARIFGAALKSSYCANSGRGSCLFYILQKAR